MHKQTTVLLSRQSHFNSLNINVFWRKLWCLLILLSFTLCNIFPSASAYAASKKKAEPTDKYASIVIDAATGMVLSQDNADRGLHPASLTKMMTMTLVFDALGAKKISQKTRLTVSSRGASMPPSKVGLKPRETISIYDALRILATKSANDIAVTVAENLGGSEERFAQLMNLKAREIGMTNTRFVNASGLHDYRQVSSARDMAKLAKYMIDTYPQYYSIFGLKSYKYNGKVFHNHNKLMSTYQGMDGIKTGYVAASGFNLVASAKKGNTRLIGVVFGGQTAASRNAKMASLLDKGFARINEIKRTGYAPQSPRLQIAQVEPETMSSIPLPPAKPLEYRSGDLNRMPQQVVAAQVLPVGGMNSLTVTPQTTVPTPTAAPAQPRQDLVNVQSLGSLVIPVGKPDRLSATPNAAIQPNVAMNQMNKVVAQSPTPAPTPAPATAQNNPMDYSTNWQIQIGAFEDRASTNKALYDTMVLLPEPLNKGKTLVVPLRTQDAKWVFRARLAGYTREEALDACSHLKTRLKDCLPIAPQSR